MRILKFILFLCFTYSDGFSQTIKTIDDLQNQDQSCLDKGDNMLGCSRHFYFQMDSMLNVVYVKLRSTLNTQEKIKLKNEQKLWLVKRNNYFKKNLNKFEKKNPDNSPSGFAWGAQDDAMFMYEDNAEFVKKRVLVLLKRLNK